MFFAPSFSASCKPVMSASILRDVVRRAADEPAERYEGRAVFCSQHHANSRRPGVSAASTVEFNRDRFVFHAAKLLTAFALECETPMWDKFAPRLRKSIFAALEVAAHHDRDEATAEDLLVAIARDEVSAAAFILDHAGVDRAALLARISAGSTEHRSQRAESVSSFCMHVLDVAVDQAADRR